MNWLLFVISFGLGCCALSVATWFLFKPARFYAPPNHGWKIFEMLTLIVLMISWILAEFKMVAMFFAKDMRAIYLGVFLIETHGRAIWYHLENATRTPSDWWERFFRGSF